MEIKQIAPASNSCAISRRSQYHKTPPSWRGHCFSIQILVKESDGQRAKAFCVRIRRETLGEGAEAVIAILDDE